jgi:hypothetical protein
MAHKYNSFSITDWFSYFLINKNYNFNNNLLPTIFLILAASIKSAQIFGHL